MNKSMLISVFSVDPIYLRYKGMDKTIDYRARFIYLFIKVEYHQKVII